MPTEPDIDEARKILSYDPETGLFRRLVRTSNRVREGEPAGGICRVHGYRTINVAGARVRAARLAWAFMTGEYPKGCIDHVNRNRADDRWVNLRLADHSTNGANMSVNRGNKAGLKGVTTTSRGRFVASIGVKGAVRYLGIFGTPQEAHERYYQEAQTVFGDYASRGTWPESMF
jgi:hypothetical protein